MGIFHYSKTERPKFISFDKASEQVSWRQYIMHWFYAVIEPSILRLSTKQLDAVERELDPVKKKETLNSMKKIGISKVGNNLPKGIPLSQGAAKNVVDYIYSVEGPKGARIAVGPCVCQRAIKDYREPVMKDMTLLYGADIYKSLDLGYKVLTAAEAKKVLDDCHEAGLIHSVHYMFDKPEGAFVMCNCDNQVCAIIRTYKISEGDFGMEVGPEICVFDSEKCLGPDECGKCLERCPVDVNKIVAGKIAFNSNICLGCEVCVTTCVGNARKMGIREDYPQEHIMSKKDLLAGLYPEYPAKSDEAHQSAEAELVTAEGRN